MDRRSQARWSLAAMQVRCLGTAAGCIGSVIGAFVGLVVLGAITHGALITLLGLPIGAFIGWWVGAFIALHLMAR